MCVFAVWLHKCQLFFYKSCKDFCSTHTHERHYIKLHCNQKVINHHGCMSKFLRPNMYFCISFEDCPNSIIMREKKIANDFEEKLNPHSLQYHRYWPNAKIYTTNQNRILKVCKENARLCLCGCSVYLILQRKYHLMAATSQANIDWLHKHRGNSSFVCNQQTMKYKLI